MIPLGIMLLLTVYFFAERFLSPSTNAARIDGNTYETLSDHIINGKCDGRPQFWPRTPTILWRGSSTRELQRIGKGINRIETKHGQRGSAGNVQPGEKPGGAVLISKAALILALWVPDRAGCS